LLTSLINEDLLDELHLIVHPVIVGRGAALLAGLDERRTLELASAEPSASGRLHVTYRLNADEQG
jgi:dihydrofolate reductase